MKLGKETGSLVNALIANNMPHVPVVGEDVTECLWTDREAWRVIEVRDNGKTAVLAKYEPKPVGNYYEQNYQYEDENGNPLINMNRTMTVTYRYKAWRCGRTKVNLAWNRRDQYEDPSF